MVVPRRCVAASDGSFTPFPPSTATRSQNASGGLAKAALDKIDALIVKQPNNPWFHEFRGEILMTAGRANEAEAAFTKAAKLDPSKSGLIQASIGQAIVTGGRPEKMKDAVAQIQRGLEADPGNSSAYRFLAMAYGKLGQIGDAELATAEGYWEAGNFKDAKVFAARAQQNSARTRRNGEGHRISSSQRSSVHDISTPLVDSPSPSRLSSSGADVRRERGPAPSVR